MAGALRAAAASGLMVSMQRLFQPIRPGERQAGQHAAVPAECDRHDGKQYGGAQRRA